MKFEEPDDAVDIKPKRCYVSDSPLIDEWDYEKNYSLCSPENTSVNSHLKVWWHCSKGHNYEATINHRYHGTGCPYCSNKKVLKGYNDLATLRPDLLLEWDYEKNTFSPDSVISGSNKIAWWKCELGHSYDMAISLRTRVGCMCPICNGKRVKRGYNDLASQRPELLANWDYKKNSFKPDKVTQKSHKKAWWKCDKCGNEWYAPISRISSGGGCPVCGKIKSAVNRSTSGFENSIAGKTPHLLDEWNYEKNNNLDPKTVNFGSNKIVWWKCSKGHEWKTAICNRTGKQATGCPVCAGKKILPGYNDLQTLHPTIAQEWDYKKNTVIPDRVGSKSNKMVWWICPNGHSYKKRVADRTSGENCPYCSGHKVLKGFNDLATKRPEVLKDWDYEKNKEITPFDVTEHSHIKVWWKCSNCGYEWNASVYSKTSLDSGCGVCSNRIVVAGMNDFASQHPELMPEWSEKNTVDPQKITSGSGKNVWWECSKCGCEWKASVYNRIYHGSGCPDCAHRLQTSMPEQVIYQYLKKYYPNVVNGFKADWLKRSEIDIFIPELNCGIEYDGARWHSNAKRDEKKSLLVNKHGIHLIRVREKKCPILNNNDTIIEVEKYDQNIDSLKPVLEETFRILNKKYNTNIEFNFNNDWDLFTRDFSFNPIGISLAEGNPKLSKEWDYEKNGKLNPENVPPNSSRKVWWKCPDCGYSYFAQISSRNRGGTGCPACKNLVVFKGHNDLATMRPDLLKEWDYERNDINPTDVVPGTRRKVWWKCSICGYSWKATIANRTTKNGTGCPSCAYSKRFKT